MTKITSAKKPKPASPALVAADRSKNRLWLYRKKMGYSQRMVAQLLGHKSPARVCDYELGKVVPSLETALKLAIILRTPLRELYSNLFRQFQHKINHKGKQFVSQS
jgi:DNA-binding XRE family transcriptional regulator